MTDVLHYCASCRSACDCGQADETCAGCVRCREPVCASCRHPLWPSRGSVLQLTDGEGVVRYAHAACVVRVPDA